MANKQKFYVVWKGKATGIFSTWSECKAQVDGYPGAQYKAFENRAQAEQAYKGMYAEALFKRKKIIAPIYSDSEIAIKWVEARKCRTKLEMRESNAQLFELIGRAEKWLLENDYENHVLTWHTEVWGEIPADFGRK